jgi:PKD repeat protein
MSTLENGRYQVQLNANGDVVSIFDKLNSRQLLSQPIRWDFLYDLSTSLPAWEIQYNNIIAAPTSRLNGPASFKILENGPARVSLAVTRANAGSTFVERIRLGAGDAGDRVEWDISASWRTRQTLLKLEFPLAVTNSYATFDLGLGTISRPNETANLYEVPAQQWADLTRSDGSYGVTIMNDCKYGWDKPNNNTLRLTIFHTPAVAGGFPYQANDSLGTHRVLLAVMGHANDWRSAGSPWVAARLNQPLQAFQTSAHEPFAVGYSNTFSFLSCDNPNVMVKALKKAQNSEEIVVRLQELTGQPQNVQLSCVAPILSARQVNGAEDPIALLSPTNGVLAVSLGGYAPMTLALTLAGSSAVLPAPGGAPLALPFNVDVISTDGNRTNGNFDNGYTYPAELMPQTLVRDGITFEIGPTNDGTFNALSCQGQTIALNNAGYDQLYFLAAAAGSNTVGTFSVSSQPTPITVPYFSGFVGQWSPPSLLTNQEAAWVCTHRHNGAGANEAYDFCYLFKERLDLPPGATSIVLPNAPNIRIFAVTLATNTTPETFAAGGRIAGNLAPWANAGPDQRVNAPGTNGPATVLLDGSASADPDGAIVSYVWSQNGAPLATGVKPSVSLPIGTNLILLTVTDNQGLTGVGQTTIIVLAPLQVSLSATPTNGSSAPLTVQFIGQASGGNLAQASDTTDDHLGTVTAEGQNNGINGNWEVATNAFDDDPSTKWLDFANANPTTRASWLQYGYANGRQTLVTSYTLTSANDAPERDPADWALLGSNDGGNTWVTLDVQTNKLFASRFETRSLTLANPAAYSTYRLRIDRVANPTSAVAVQLAEMELIGPPAYALYWAFGNGATATSMTAGAPVSVQHTYTNNGTYTVVLGVVAGIYTGTNTVQITVGTPLTATAGAAPAAGAPPLQVQFTGRAIGGRPGSVPIDTTEDHLGTVTAQGENNGLNGLHEVAANAFDDVTGTKWLDFADNYPNTRQSWIQYQYANGARYTVSQYSVTSANDSTIYPERNPADWRLLASNDGGASWATLDVRSNQIFSANFQKLSYAVATPAGYNCYRFQVDRVANPASAVAVQLDELEFIASPPFYSYWWSFGDGTTSLERNPQYTYPNSGSYTVVFSVSDGLSTATDSMVMNVEPPSIALTFAAAGQATLTWPAWASGYHLYSTTNLTPPTAWTPVTNSVTPVGSDLTVTLTPEPTGARFFQLRSP